MDLNFQKKIKFYSILFLSFIILLFLFDKIIMPQYTHHGEEVELPDVTEKPFADADSLLIRQGFQVMQPPEEKFDSQYPAGIVLMQNPQPFSTVKKGRRIYLTISMGEKPVIVPSLIGTSARDAENVLRNQGIQMGNVRSDFSSYYPEGVVINQAIRPNQEVKRGTPLDILVSLGAMPQNYIIPNVLGRSYEEAKTLILKSGLQIGRIRKEFRPDLLPGTIIGQSKTGGIKTLRGDSLHLVVTIDEEKK